jgi:hypothetical protein
VKQIAELTRASDTQRAQIRDLKREIESLRSRLSRPTGNNPPNDDTNDNNNNNGVVSSDVPTIANRRTRPRPRPVDHSPTPTPMRVPPQRDTSPSLPLPLPLIVAQSSLRTAVVLFTFK